jgi:NADH-quinone oxidoreductase subunit N
MKVFAPVTEYWQYLLFVVVVLSITIANLFAIRQSDLKRFMAFSSISQAGYIVLAIVGNNTMSVTALSFYVLIYIVANMSVFTVISAVEEHNNGTVEINSYNGLYNTNPRLAFLLTLALFSLGGIPPFAGFFSKFFIFLGAAQTHNVAIYVLVFIALVNTIISLYYYLLVVKAMFIRQDECVIPAFKSHWTERAGLWICTLGIIFIGLVSCIYAGLSDITGSLTNMFSMI